MLGWWRDLSALQPHRLWFAHLLLHRVEVLVEIVVSSPAAELGQALLGLLARSKAAVDLPSLAGELRTDTGLLTVLVMDLERSGLIRHVNHGWQIAAPVESAEAPPSNQANNRRERRSFSFVAETPPLYLPLAPPAASPLAAPAGWSFDLAVLKSCVNQSAEWKEAHGFPREVIRILRPTATPEDWRSVALARAEQALLVLAERGERGEVLGFPVRADGWTLGRDVMLTLPGGVAVLAPLLRDIDAEAWKQSWQVWCHQRNLPAGDAESCQVEPVGHRLVVRAPARLLDRLRGARSDALKGEAWLLAGSGMVREIARIDLGESGTL
jgi:hypothetical protein